MVKVGEVKINESGEYTFKAFLSESELWPGSFVGV